MNLLWTLKRINSTWGTSTSLLVHVMNVGSIGTWECSSQTSASNGRAIHRPHQMGVPFMERAHDRHSVWLACVLLMLWLVMIGWCSCTSHCYPHSRHEHQFFFQFRSFSFLLHISLPYLFSAQIFSVIGNNDVLFTFLLSALQRMCHN